ncbi:helix-turn-helix domain-containing protein [Streptomyces phaeochromogenes]|uniref:Helix-turn-helix domain-containing protein n=1 Tax=Streptomyces phaeochromogenes TaxID=1923 RepID=A0ABZ1HRM1_STRPH|nr:helix-turn-helix transcriptional regulator [Streptomyces phaeochromogenes]WSD21252.1 helix-turn-helix domain-containing protein [Streptomyces phaeochromogenes]
MVATSHLPIGRNVRSYRRRDGRTLTAIAGLCGITERYLEMIEAGSKVPSADVLARLAAELGVPLAALFTEAPVDEPATRVSTAPAIARALMGYAPPANAAVLGPAQLRERVETVWRIWQSSRTRFTEIADILPALIEDVEHAVRTHRGAGDAAVRREVLRVAADLYGLLRSYCRRTGRLDLSLMVADRAIRAAEDADDPVRIAVGTWNLGHVLLSHTDPGAVEEAKHIALQAVGQLRHAAPASPEAAAVQGALELVAVVSDARRRRWTDARRRLAERAAPLAKQVGEGNIAWTVFGPTNVALHAISVEMLAGDAAEGLRLADQIDTGKLPSRERQFTHRLELASCHALRRDDAAVLVHLLDLEDLAPEDLVHSPFARDMVLQLQRRIRPVFRRQVSGLVERLQLA